jgi:hypothetical protein
MNTLPIELQIKIALELDYPGILALCQTSEIFNNRICKNIANAYYKIKSHKFDNWYEMVNSISFRFNNENDCIEISFNVDHGS